MDPILKNKLTKISDDFGHDGIDAFNDLTAEDYLDLESMLNTAISQAEDWEQDDLIKLRFMFRVMTKYWVDIDRGITLLLKYDQ